MKYIIIGLGNFGGIIASQLTKARNEVIGVDIDMAKVENYKEKLTHTICLDATDTIAVRSLPLNDTDVIMVCIGEDEGANLMTTALMKQYKPKRLIARAVSELHKTILEAMGVEEIIHPEEETATRWTKKLSMPGVVESFELCDDYSIIEATVPQRYIGKTLQEIDLRSQYNLLVLTTITEQEEKNIIGASKTVQRIKGVAVAETKLNEGDILVLYGNIKNIRKMLDE